jgi:hypothetical protein
MSGLKFTEEDVSGLMELLKGAEERVACLKKIIIHEEETIKKLRPILRKYCDHEWKNIAAFNVENNSQEWKCERCLLIKE